MEAAESFGRAKKLARVPLVADIHFDYRLALAAIEQGADKIRINPGNIGSADRVKAVVDKAREHDIPIRVGVNSGSLEKGLIEKYGDRIGFIGGFDSNGPVGRESATPEAVDAEVMRCLDSYGKWHRGYCFFGFRTANTLDPAVVASYIMPIAQKATEYAFELMMAGK
jgi:4-hydroxy-3-methylbut-2-en-1-yl diphosphate synthase IspG/GcpE